RKLAAAGEATAIVGPLLALFGKLIELLGTALLVLIWPLSWLRDSILASSHPVWADFAATTVLVSTMLFLLAGGIRTGWHALAVSLVSFAGVGVVIAVMGLDRGGLPVVDTRLWGGLLVTL